MRTAGGKATLEMCSSSAREMMSNIGITSCSKGLLLCEIVTGEGHKTQSVFRRRLSRVERSRTQSSKTLKLRIVPKLNRQLDCPQRRRRLNLGSPRPKSCLLSTGNPTTNGPQLRIDNITQTPTQLTNRLLVQPHNRIQMSSHISTKHETVTYHQNPGPGWHQYDAP